MNELVALFAPKRQRVADAPDKVVVQRRPPICWIKHWFGPWTQLSDYMQQRTCLRCGVYRSRFRMSVSKWL